ncbi:uncharacterized protein [Heptranchias perlo]|uniref:uncharacterized protein n=1 Tax=Heptranchias perlo TaxID=212740 RepID=UPI00355A06C2
MSTSVRDCLVNALDDLKDLKRFIPQLCEYKFRNFDPIGRGLLKGATVPDVVDQIIRRYTEQNASEVTVNILEAINEKNVAHNLSRVLENIRNGGNIPGDEPDAPARKREKYSEDRADASSSQGLWTLSAMERHATKNMDELYKSLRDRIGEEAMRTIEDSVRRKKMKTSFFIVGKEAHEIVNNTQFKNYRSQSNRDISLFPLKLAGNYLFEGMTSKGQRANKGEKLEAGVDDSVPMCGEFEKEPSSKSANLRKPTGTGELQSSGPTEVKDSLDVVNPKGTDKVSDVHDMKPSSLDSGFEQSLAGHGLTQIEHEKEEEEEGNERGASALQSQSQGTSLSTPGTAGQSIRKVASSGTRAPRKEPKRKIAWAVGKEIDAKKAAKEQWLQKQEEQILKEDVTRSRGQVFKELEESLEQIHNWEHPVYSCLRARCCLVYKVPRNDGIDKVILLLQLPGEEGGEKFDLLTKNRGLRKMHSSCIQYNMGVLGGISRTDVVFYNQGSATTHTFNYNRSEFDSITQSLEVFIKDVMVPLLAVYLRVQRKQGVFLKVQD